LLKFLIPLAAAAVILSLVKVVPEHERYAIYIFGRFAGFKGPGLVVRLRGTSTQWRRITTGERGVVISHEVGRFAAGDLPMLLDGPAVVGRYVRVTGFEPKRVLTAIDRDQPHVVVCEKCGHANHIE
jgi:regulator of protease activity HflC (stomatin/prohibitin superfamily)